LRSERLHKIFTGQLPHFASEFQFKQRSKDLGRREIPLESLDYFINVSSFVRFQEAQDLALVRPQLRFPE
jgi:hypothetical protein